ncbi:FxsB family radical SAM/SPASM domain protein [Kitasatospora sp. YST-16]|uniref:FxsB family cyclophane-forming radical SAM/SPASM peptide maturase n=1 Tax=Kitasatospora sp. YST-16 TaxID=2998080 RepID=UPI0022833243|nr:FxsB family cyclophane-forming radical SAM/SPASM peptide maturase [Kitasatospora sp. YST-16]WAL73368.1 FxsB family radical SAM/SPASM domain protein [Kitasatospora sp. YST-16]WNW39424.1 FxsB family cyclophane-forming radical SAM/SPASM peptide maturase [Streptomyces sp. Li-HN-5-13]
MSATVPFSQFVIKVHSRCDLACDHCYVYEHSDTSWSRKARATTEQVLARTAARIAEHARAHRLPAVHVVLHGGEPLLAGATTLRRAAELLRGALPEGCVLDLRIHTNGVLLSRRFCELFAAQGIKVGISLDGDRLANDRHRLFPDGRSSHAKVLAALALLREPEFRHLYAGLLCTVDVANDPIAVYEALVAEQPPRIDFLLPHATWDHPPVRPEGSGPTPYADWLLAIHRHWTAQGRPVPVRIFDSVHRTLRGRSSLTESLGLDPADLVVVETDGTLEQADSLKTAYDGAPATGFDVFAHSLDEVARHPGLRERQSGLAGLAAQCRACPVVRSCGGGLYAHRYRTGGGFDHPSVYCGDLLKLITTIRDRTAAAPAAVPAQQRQPVTDRHLDELARGFGGAETVNALGKAQLELSRRLVTAVGAAGNSAAWQLLAETDRSAPGALDGVLAHPYVRVWAVRCLGGDPRGDLGGLAELAAAAAARGRAGFELLLPVRDGWLHLPTLGRLRMDGRTEAVLRGDADGLSCEEHTVRWDRPGDHLWQPVRRAALPGWTLALEDTDPQRDSHQWPVAGRLSEAELLDWTGGLREAWELLGRDLPEYAAGIAAGLGTVTPLAPGPNGRDVSAAARQAYGAVGIARPSTAPVLALLLAHEFQHVKLGAVLDLFDLYDQEDGRLYYAPWRPDPRPLEGLLQGTYAHLAVAAYWASRVRAFDGVRSEAAAAARLQLATWRTHTADAVGTLAGSGSLTPLGQRFAEGMRATLAASFELPVGAAAERAAKEAVAADRAVWQEAAGRG